jgi:hypothetical protein
VKVVVDVVQDVRQAVPGLATMLGGGDVASTPRFKG